jgi:hypothetical protein
LNFSIINITLSIDKQAYYALLVLAFVLSVLQPNRSDSAIKALSLLLLLSIIAQWIADVVKAYGIPNYVVFHIYSLFEYPLYCLYFYRILTYKSDLKSKYSRKIQSVILVSIAFYILVYFYYYGYIADIFLKQSFGFISALNGLFVTALSVFFYFHTINKRNIPNILKYPHFYIVSANLIFFCTQIPLISLDQFLLESNDVWRFHFHNIYKLTNFALYTLYCIGLSINLWKQRKY